MATHTLVRMFDSYVAASAAVGELEAAGFSQESVGLIANDGRARQGTDVDVPALDAGQDQAELASAAAAGAGIGAVVGGSAGLLAGIGTLAIPGLGPVVAAGWLIAALTGAGAGAGAGAAAGGLIGVLTGAGVGDAEAQVYAEGVRRGAALVSVRAIEDQIGQAEAILARHGPVDLAQRRDELRATGWSG